jgi:hypothetical protein
VTQALSKKVGEQTGSDGKRQEDQQALSVVLAFRHAARGDVSVSGGWLQFPPPHPHVLLMPAWKPTPAKTKTELREMLAEAVRNTQPPQPETKPKPKPLPKAKKGRGPNGTH